jgi:hypothetical protein
VLFTKEPEFTDTKVQAGKEYEYRVSAENEAGESEPSEVSKPIKAKPLKGTFIALIDDTNYLFCCHFDDKTIVSIDKHTARAEAPKVDLDALGGREIRVRAGEPIKIEVPITGAPTPTVAWKKEGNDLLASPRVTMENGEDKAVLSIPVSKRDDSGKYTIAVKNANGEDAGDIKIVVLGKQ